MAPCELNGTITLTTSSGWTLPLCLLWSSQNNRYRQPYNQIGISPRYKNWLTLHAGYRNVMFSPLTLAGHTFLGAGAELNLGLVRVGLVVGKFNRAINADYADPDRVATFRRRGFSAKVGVGNQRSYLDLILLRVADDIHSIQTDSLTQPTPAENLVLGLSGRLQLRQKLSLELDMAKSAYTHDSRTMAVSKTDYPERLRYLAPFTKLLTVRQSTQVYTAIQAAFRYRSKWADLKLLYKRIEPSYKSMGAYYFQNDIEQVTVAPLLKLFKKRLNLRTSLGWQHDNLFNQKKFRTNRLIGSVSASYSSVSNLNLDLSYSTYGITQRSGYRPLTDTARLAQNNRTLSGSAFKIWMGQTLIHTLSGSASYQSLLDMNPFTTNRNASQNWYYSLNYAWQHLTAHLDLSVGYSYTRTTALDMNSIYSGPSVSLSKKIAKNEKLSLQLSVNYLKSQEQLTGFDQTGSLLSTMINIDYQLTPIHRLSANWSNQLNHGQQTVDMQQGSVQYAVNF
jgi:hypothetical protein